MKKISKKVLAVIVAMTMLVQSGLAQGAVMPANGILLPSDTLSLPMIRGLQFDPSEPLNFNFVVDLADRNAITEAEALKLVRYFMAVIAVPASDVWVNLSPDGKDRIIAPNFGATEAGEDLLKQDLLLKKLSSSFLHPDQELGRKFWDAAYQKIYDVYGLTEIPQDAFSRIWIVPQKAVIDEFKNAAYISESRLKVLTEEAYEVTGNEKRVTGTENTARYPLPVAHFLEEIVLPAIEKEINEGEHFAVLRQVYQSMILAVWFKSKLKDHVVNRVYSDSSKTEGIDLGDKNAETQIFDSYLNIFRNGLYDDIREDYDPVTQEMTVRKYVSGGFGLPAADEWMDTRAGTSNAMLSSSTKNILLSVSFFLLASTPFGLENLKRGDPVVPQDYTAIQLLEKFVSVDEVAGLNGQINSRTGRTYNIDANYIRANWDNIFKDPKIYGWALEAVTVAAEKKLGLVEDGNLGPEVISGMQSGVSRNTPNPSSSEVGLNTGSTSGGSFKGVEKDSSNKTDVNVKFSDVKQDATVVKDSVSMVLKSDTLLQKNERDSFVIVNPLVAKKDSLSFNLLSDTLSVGGSSPPPPEYWKLSFYNDVTMPSAGGSPSWAALQYGVFGLSYTDGPATVGVNVETSGYWQDSLASGTAAPYWTFTYMPINHLTVGATHRSAAKGILPVTIVTADYQVSPELQISSALAWRNEWNPAEHKDVLSRALTLSASGQFGKFSIQPSLYLMPNGFRDWSFNASFVLTSKDKVYFERNPDAKASAFGYAPNQPLRLGISVAPNASWTINGYVSSAQYNVDRENLAMGLAFKYVLQKDIKRKKSSNKAMLKTSTTEVKNGGIDLKMNDAQLETRGHGTFEGFRNLDMNMINPETFRGFGVKLIEMRPIFDLSKVFAPDNALAMVSQL